MRYEVLRGFCRGAGVNCEPGEVIEVEPKDAREWEHLGYITKAAEVVAAPVEESADEENTDEGGEGDEHPEQDAETLAGQDDKPTTREPKRPAPKRR